MRKSKQQSVIAQVEERLIWESGGGDGSVTNQKTKHEVKISLLSAALKSPRCCWCIIQLIGSAPRKSDGPPPSLHKKRNVWMHRNHRGQEVHTLIQDGTMRVICLSVNTTEANVDPISSSPNSAPFWASPLQSGCLRMVSEGQNWITDLAETGNTGKSLIALK